MCPLSASLCSQCFPHKDFQDNAPLLHFQMTGASAVSSPLASYQSHLGPFLLFSYHGAMLLAGVFIWKPHPEAWNPSMLGANQQHDINQLCNYLIAIDVYFANVVLW